MRRTARSSAAASWAMLVAGTLLACGGQSPPPRAPAASSPEPTLVVERFLRAVNANDLGTMMELFGTKEGPSYERDGVDETEERMFALASLLRHQDYRIAGNRIVPGRMREATEIVVRMRIGEREVLVPYTLVRTDDNGWLIEQVDVLRITQVQF